MIIKDMGFRFEISFCEVSLVVFIVTTCSFVATFASIAQWLGWPGHLKKINFSLGPQEKKVSISKYLPESCNYRPFCAHCILLKTLKVSKNTKF